MAVDVGALLALPDVAPWLSVEPYSSLYKPQVGDWYRTKDGWTDFVCFGYSAPMDPITGEGGNCLGRLGKGEYFGPVEEYLLTPTYLAVLVKGWWINIWTLRGPRENGIYFAYKVPEIVVARWKRNGWRD